MNRLIFILFTSICFIGCKSEQNLNNDLAEKILNENWKPDPNDDTHYKIDTFKVIRVERINDKVLANSIISGYEEVIENAKRKKQSASDLLKSLNNRNLNLADSVKSYDEITFKNMYYRNDSIIINCQNVIDSILSKSFDTLKKENYLVLSYMSHTSTYGRGNVYQWLYLDRKYRVVHCEKSEEF